MNIKHQSNIVETIKTVVIAVLITAIVAFIGGVKYEQANTGRISQAVQSASVKQTVKD